MADQSINHFNSSSLGSVTPSAFLWHFLINETSPTKFHLAIGFAVESRLIIINSFTKVISDNAGISKQPEIATGPIAFQADRVLVLL